MNRLTPREVAHDIALEALRAAHREGDAWIGQYKLSPSQSRKAKNWIAHLHNKLLDQSGLQGLKLEVETK